MLEIGLTGGIASGKSTVAAMFAELGAHIIDLDQLARQAVAKGSPALEAIAREFGPGVLTPAGELDRPAMRRLIFDDPQARSRLNAIVHPEARRLARQEKQRIAQRDPDAILIYDVPLLFETNSAGRYRAVILVYVPPEVQIARLMARDGVDRRAAQAALAAQMPIDQKRRLAQFLVDNSKGLEETREQVAGVWRSLCRLARGPKGAKGAKDRGEG